MNSNSARSWALAALLMGLLGVRFWSAAKETTDEHGEKHTLFSRLFRHNSIRVNGTGELTSSKLARRAASKGGEMHAAASGKDDVVSCTLTGRVIDENNAPIKDAKITIRNVIGSFSKTCDTDEHGKFLADSLPPATYDILAAHPQYVTLIRPNYTLKPEKSIPRIEFRLPLGAKIKGKVVDEDGKAIDRVKVAAHRRHREQLSGGKTYLDDATYKTEQSNKDGEFEIAGVSTGENVFEFTRPGYDFEVMETRIAPEKAGDPLKVVMKKSGKIAGLVVDEENHPIGTTTVFLARYKPFGDDAVDLPKEKYTVTTDAYGQFEFKKLFDEGFYDLRVDSAEYAPGIFPLVSVGTSNLSCKLERGGIIEGRAEFIDRETTAAPVVVAAETIIKGTTFTLEAQASGIGEFHFKNMPFGTYKLYANSTGYLNEPKEGVACSKDVPARNIVLEIYEASHIRGTVADAENGIPVSDAKITVSSTYGLLHARSKKFEIHSDGHGRFDFYRLPAGLHTVQAAASGYVISGGGGAMQRFSLLPGENKLDVALRLDHGGTIDGFVLSPDGKPLSQADVQLYPVVGNNAASKKWKARTDGQGYFKIWGIEVGDSVRLFSSARKQGFTKTRGPLVELTAKKPVATTQITMSPGTIVAGKVTDLKELPVPGAQVDFVSSSFPNDPSPSSIQVYTRSDGSYLLENCAPGAASVTVSRSGFVQDSRALSLREEVSQTDVNFKLNNGYRIAGTVTSLEGKPIANAKVHAVGVNGAAGTDESITDKTGHYVLTNLGSGYFNLDSTFDLKTADGNQRYVFLLPNVPTGNASADFDCDVGNSVTGYVEGDDNRGLNSFSVSLHSVVSTQPAQDFTFNFDKGFSTAGGVYRVLNAPRGVYSMSVSADGYEAFHDENVYVGPHKRTVLPKISLRSAGGVMGIVKSSTTDRPVNDVTVSLTDRASGRVYAGKSDYTGQFRIGSVPSGSYLLETDHPNYLATRFDGVSVVTRKSTDLGELFLQAGGTVYGSVLDDSGNPIPNVAINVSGVTPAKATVTDAAGNYVLQGIRDGNWPIVAQGTLNSRKIYAFHTVGVQADESETADFQFETSADLDGIVAMADGLVRSGNVRIHAFDEHANVLEDVYYDGAVHSQSFSIPQVPPGQYFLWSSGLGISKPYSLWKNIFLNRGKNTLSLLLSAANISGTAQTEDGKQISGVPVQLRPITPNFRLPQKVYDSLVRLDSTDQNGAFNFATLQSGAYQLLFLTPFGEYAGQWIAMPPLSIGQDQRISGYDIPLGQ
jgi:protocatechuate 3,4-dioxygenase beta subunit